METRDRDKISKSTSSTPAGDVNRNIDKHKDDSSVNFGEKIGRSDNLESEKKGDSGSIGSMGDSGRSSGSDLGSSSGRSGSSNLGEQSDVDKSNRGGSSGIERL